MTVNATVTDINDKNDIMAVSKSNDDFGKCALYNKTSGSSDNIFHIANQYGGIPQNLVTNLIFLAVLVALFIVLRKSAWKLVNKIVNRDDMERWTQIFFSFTVGGGAIFVGCVELLVGFKWYAAP